MSPRPLFELGLGRLGATAGVVALAAGLPMTLALNERIGGRSSQLFEAHASESIAISSPLRISDRLPLTLDRGFVLMTDRTLKSSVMPPAQITVDEAVLTVDLSERGARTAPLPGPDARPAFEPHIAGFSAGSLKLRRASILVVGPHGGRATMGDVNATLTTTRKGSYRLTGAGFLHGQRVSIDAIWSDAGTPQIPMRLAVLGPMVEAVVDGTFKPGVASAFTGQAEYRVASLKKFVSWLGLGGGIGDQLKSIVLSGPIEWSPSQTAFPSASISFDGGSATGALTIKHGGGRLSLDGTLGFNELDVARYIPMRPIGIPAESREPHVLTVIDADLRLSAARVSGPAFQMGRGAVSIALNKGRLQADMAELQIEGGTAGGQLSMDLNQPAPKAEFKVKLKGVDAGRVLAEPLRRNPLLGRANVHIEGTLGGSTLSEMTTSLTGRGQFDLAEPGRLGLDLPALVHAARAGGSVGWSAAGKGGTPLDMLGGRFRVLNGALTIEAVQARSGATSMAGSGRLDVPGRLMDLTIAWGGADAAATATDVLLMRGTWDAPTITLSRVPKAEVKVEAPLRSH